MGFSASSIILLFSVHLLVKHLETPLINCSQSILPYYSSENQGVSLKKKELEEKQQTKLFEKMLPPLASYFILTGQRWWTAIFSSSIYNGDYDAYYDRYYPYYK